MSAQRFAKNKDETQNENGNQHSETGKQLTLSENTGFFPVKAKQQVLNSGLYQLIIRY